MTAKSKLVLFAVTLILMTACDKKASKSPSSAESSQRKSTATAPTTPKPKLPVPVDLTVDQIKAAKDGQVEQLIFDAELKAIGSRYDWEAEIVNAWPAGLRMLYATWVVETEVNNGGFDQYFSNTGGKTAQAALDGFKLIGATQHADLMASAIEIRDAEEAEMAKYKQDKSNKSISESIEHKKLKELDTKFYKMTEDLSALRVKYIRAHPEAFVTPS